MNQISDGNVEWILSTVFRRWAARNGAREFEYEKLSRLGCCQLS
jgi:hypothetical protein